MVDTKILKRLARGVNTKRADLNIIHIKGMFAEVSNGTHLIREIVSDKEQKEETLDFKTFKVTPKPYPDVQSILDKTEAVPTVYQFAFKKATLEQFIECLPDSEDKIVFEVKGAEKPFLFKCGKVSGLVMPAEIIQKGDPIKATVDEKAEKCAVDAVKVEEVK